MGREHASMQSTGTREEPELQRRPTLNLSLKQKYLMDLLSRTQYQSLFPNQCHLTCHLMGPITQHQTVFLTNCIPGERGSTDEHVVRRQEG